MHEMCARDVCTRGVHEIENIHVTGPAASTALTKPLEIEKVTARKIF